MWNDYGYIEDERGRIYDFRLLIRLSKYARPYKWILGLCVLLIVLGTGADLVLPYLTKVAVDRFIVKGSVMIRSGPETAPDIRSILEKNRARLTLSGQSGVFFLSPENARLVDPDELRKLKDAGVYREETFYLVPGGSGEAWDTALKYPDIFKKYPYLLAGATLKMDRIPTRDLTVIRSGDISGLARLALIAALVLVVGYVFEFFQVILLEYSGQKLTHDLRQDMMAHVLAQSVAFHDRTNTGRLVARVTNDVQNLSEMIKSVAVTFFRDTFVLSGIVVILLYINWRLALVTFALIPFIVMTTLIFRRRAREVFRDLRTKISQINSVIGETISGIRVIQAFNREKVNREQFNALNHDNYLAGVRQVRVFAVFMPLIDLLAAVALGLIIWYGGLGVIGETMTLGAVVAYISYVRKFFQPIRDLAEKFNILQSAMASLERIFKLMAEQTTLPVSLDPKSITPGAASIEFDHVDFAYHPDNPVLKNVSFRIEPGQTTAIVGATGAGKSSVINLLLRFYDVTSGRILVDGVDVRDLDPAEHRRRIGLVMQDVFLFAGSIRENIAISRDNPLPREVIEAAEAVGADHFIKALPQGYEQPLGEGGLSLSVGQRQLLSFSRALLQDPQILVLDEATAFIDSETEKLIETALERLTSGRTSIVIAHRLSTIRRADRILVLHGGKVWESGTHEELIRKKGLYFRLHELQFGRKDPELSEPAKTVY